MNFGIDGIKDSILYMPGCHKNLLSVRKLADRGLCCLFTKKQVFVLNTKKKIASGGFQNKATGLYSLPVITKLEPSDEVANLYNHTAINSTSL